MRKKKPNKSEENEAKVIKLVKQANGLIEARYNFSIWEMRLFKTMVSLIKPADQEFKKTNLGKEWNKFKYSGNPLKDNSSFEVYEHIMTVREFLQRLGTEAMREGLHENVWLNAIYSDFDFEKSKWCITDMRFKNELESVKKNCGITVRINRPNSIIIDHPSETELDNEQFDYVIENNGTLEDFEQKIDDLLQKFNII